MTTNDGDENDDDDFVWKMRRNVINIKSCRCFARLLTVEKFSFEQIISCILLRGWWRRLRETHVVRYNFLFFILNGGCSCSGYDKQKFYAFLCMCFMFFYCILYMKCKTFQWTFPFHKTQQKNKIYSLWARSQILIIYNSWDGLRCCMEVKDVENIA